MSLIQKLAAPPRKLNNFDVWVAGLPEKDRAAVLAAGKGKEWGHKALYLVLVEEGLPPWDNAEAGAKAISKWRAGL